MLPEDRDPICDQLRQARERRGWSIQRMSAHCGMPAVVIGSYERGDRNPPLSRLRDWAAVLGHEVLVVGPSSGAANTWSEYAVVFDTSVDGEPKEERIDCGDLAEAQRIHEAIPFSRLLNRLVTAGDWEKV